MSTSMYWRPVPKEPRPAELPYDLKRAIAQRLWGHDGSLWGEATEIDRSILPYLEGLRDAGVDGAAELIAAIQQHDKVEVWIAG